MIVADAPMSGPMGDHAFGGRWTDDKLARLTEYLRAWTTIFSANPRARHFETWYVDAFAGTGVRTYEGRSEASLFDDVYIDEDAVLYQDGSAKIALSLSIPFNRYLFVEKSKSRVLELRTMVEQEHPDLLDRCIFKQGDANKVLKDWCASRDWAKERAVVFLDPYGMQVEWLTIETLAQTKAVDLWYLFPLGIGVARLLRRDGAIDESWQARLDALFGTTEWRDEFYEIQDKTDLFGTVASVERSASVSKIKEFVEARLRPHFPAVADGRVLRNSKASPLYLLCFAAANEKGAPTALKIAKYILKD